MDESHPQTQPEHTPPPSVTKRLDWDALLDHAPMPSPYDICECDHYRHRHDIEVQAECTTNGCWCEGFTQRGGA